MSSIYRVEVIYQMKGTVMVHAEGEQDAINEAAKRVQECGGAFMGGRPVQPPPPYTGKSPNIKQHVGHCCQLHGCKYGDRKCPVVTKKFQQEYLCMDCEHVDVLDSTG